MPDARHNDIDASSCELVRGSRASCAVPIIFGRTLEQSRFVSHPFVIVTTRNNARTRTTTEAK